MLNKHCSFSLRKYKCKSFKADLYYNHNAARSVRLEGQTTCKNQNRFTFIIEINRIFAEGSIIESN